MKCIIIREEEEVGRWQGTHHLYLIQGGGAPSGATSGGVGGSVASASLLKLQQQQQQPTAVPLQQQQPSTNAPQPSFNQVNYQTINLKAFDMFLCYSYSFSLL